MSQESETPGLVRRQQQHPHYEHYYKHCSLSQRFYKESSNTMYEHLQQGKKLYQFSETGLCVDEPGHGHRLSERLRPWVHACKQNTRIEALQPNG